MQLLFICFTGKKCYTHKSWSHIFNKYLLTVIKRMKKFENKQKVVSEWRKLFLELRAEYIHKFMFYTFLLFVGISKVRNYTLRLLSPAVHVTPTRIRPRYLDRFYGDYDKTMNFYMRNISRIVFHSKDSFRYIVERKACYNTKKYTWSVYV